jgi:hypothetical protein
MPDGSGAANQQGRKFKTVKPTGATVGPTVHVEPAPLKSIFIRVDAPPATAERELKAGRGGTVIFTSVSGEAVSAVLLKTWFPAGTWDVIVDSQTLVKAESIKCEFPKDLDPAIVERLKAVEDKVLAWAGVPSADLAAINRMIKSATGKHARIVVSYAAGRSGNAKSRTDKVELSDANTKVLADEAVAELYLQFVEHFGGVKVDFGLARGGLTPEEIKEVEQSRPAIIEITNLFTQGFAEFSQAKGAANPPVGLSEFRSMEEAIFYQKKAKNDLAARNLLAIGMGVLLDVSEEDGSRILRPDIGVIRRAVGGEARLLLYDRHGYPVRGLVGYVDSEHRSVNLEKIKRETGIPFLKIEVEDKGLYLFLRSIEQTLGEPTREVEALAVSLYKHAVFITLEVKKRYNGEIGERLIQMAPAVIGFFVAHAFAAWLAKRHPVGAALMALLKAAGMVLGFDAVFLTSARLTEAGRHFTQMEELHREAGDKEPQLTRLSAEHLRLGTAALIDAMAELVIAGIFLFGPFVAVKAGRTFLKGIRKLRSQARTELTIQNGEATQIKTIKPTKEVEIVGTKPTPETEGFDLPGDPDAPPPKSKPVEDGAGPYVGEGQKGKQPEHVPVVAKKPRALDMTPEQFAGDEAAQLELFEAAKQARARQEEMGLRVLLEAGVKDADLVSLLKRDDFKGFRNGILKKVGKERKGYETIGQMTDIIRGRINVARLSDLARVVQVLRRFPEFAKSKLKGFGVRVEVKDGYPRFHIDAIDPVTGIKHEWQIGTQATTRLYEKPGIEVGKLPIKEKNRNIHDIEYDIFGAIDEPSTKLPAPVQADLRALSKALGFRAFRRKVAELSARTVKEEIPKAELEAAIDALHKEASALLKALVDERGIDFVRKFIPDSD